MTKIKSIKKEQFKGIVHNVEVNKNNNYFANNILVHNCYTSSTINGKHGDINYVLNLLPVLKSAGVMEIVLGGGEPTVHPEFLTILKALKDLNFKIGFTTKNYNLHKHPDIEAILDNTNSIAFSINSLQDVEDLKPFMNEITVAKGRVTRQNPQFYAQIILGLEPWENTFTIVKAAIKKTDNKTLFYNITFLGLKKFGFGQDFENQITDDNWIFDIKKLSNKENISIGIDSILANKYRDILINEHSISYNRLTGAEGQQTCYIDAVDKKISASSFTNKNVRDFEDVNLPNFLNHYLTF
jgi:organic radical activating enzyme